MKNLLETTNFSLSPGCRILDFGCASGIMLRWLADFAGAGEVWGVDVRADPIIWLQRNLSPLFRFLQTTSFPHLPFEDCYFDLVYAGSVFTHIADLAEAWLLELKRIVRPGGRLYITISDNVTVDLSMSTERQAHPYHELLTTINGWLRPLDEESHFLSAGYSMITYDGAGGPHVFYDIDYLRQHWGNYAKILSINQEVYGLQTAVVLEK